MTASKLFDSAVKVDKASTWAFWTGTLVAFMLFVFQKAEAWLAPILLVVAALGIVLNIIVRIFQNQGNRALRETQITDALKVCIGENPRKDYYNNSLPPSLHRLAATTFENTFFTSKILWKMLQKERLKLVLFSVLFVLLIAFRWTSIGLLLVVGQSLFSLDFLFRYIRLECYKSRVTRIREQLHQYFLQCGRDEAIDTAITLQAFTDFECTKDEAGMPLDGEVFEELKQPLSVEWEQLKAQLKIGSSETTTKTAQT